MFRFSLESLSAIFLSILDFANDQDIESLVDCQNCSVTHTIAKSHETLYDILIFTANYIL